MEATLKGPWEQQAASRRGGPRPTDDAARGFGRWLDAVRHLARFEGALRARILVLFLCTVAGFAITTIGGASLERFVAPAGWVLASVAELLLVVGVLGFVGKVGRETSTRGYGALAVGAFLLAMTGSTAYALTHFVGADLGLLIAGRAVGAGWALLIAHFALGVGLLASVKIMTRTAQWLDAPVPLTHARSARALVVIATGAVVATHLIHLLGTPSAALTASTIAVTLTLALVAGARVVGAARHLRGAIDEALDAGEVGMPERWFAKPTYA